MIAVFVSNWFVRVHWALPDLSRLPKLWYLEKGPENNAVRDREKSGKLFNHWYNESLEIVGGVPWREEQRISWCLPSLPISRGDSFYLTQCRAPRSEDFYDHFGAHHQLSPTADLFWISGLHFSLPPDLSLCVTVSLLCISNFSIHQTSLLLTLGSPLLPVHSCSEPG